MQPPQLHFVQRHTLACQKHPKPAIPEPPPLPSDPPQPRAHHEINAPPCPLPHHDAQLGRVCQGSALAAAIRYGLRHWEGLCRFLDDGTLELDTNSVEREIRPICVTRKAALFAGSEGGGETWAIATTLIRTAILSGVNPQAWLADVLEWMVTGRVRAMELATLLTWTWHRPGAAAAA